MIICRTFSYYRYLYGDGSFSLHAANLEYGTVGIRLAQNLGIGAQWDGFLKIYAPKRKDSWI